MSKPGRMDVPGASPREVLVAEVLAGCSAHLTPEQTVLLIDDVESHIAAMLRERGIHHITQWSRHAFGVRAGTAWPAPGQYDVVIVRLARAKDVFDMNLHLAASRLREGGELLVCGANDEGAKSAQKRIATLFPDASTRDTRKHCRVIRALWQGGSTRGDTLDAWQSDVPSPIEGRETPWRHYPGLFAKGRLDDATAMLIAALPMLPKKARVLDFAAGGGVISAALHARQPGLFISMLDADAIALTAAKHNVPGAVEIICSDAWHMLPPEPRFDVIVSNPPIHRGKIEDFTALTALVKDAMARLAEGGSCWLVVQRQVPVEELLEGWRETSIASQNNRFRVWQLKK